MNRISRVLPRVSRWVSCRAMVISAVLLLASAPAQYRYPSGALSEVATFSLLVPAVVAIFLHIRYPFHGERCPHHPKTAAQLRKLRYRIVLLWRRLAPAVLTLCIIAVLVRSALSEQGDKQTLAVVVFNVVVVAILLSLVPAYLFGARNRHLLPVREPSARTAALLERLFRLCHRSHWFVVASTLAFVGAVLFAPEKGPWKSLVFVSVIVMQFAYEADRRHSSTLCEPCVAEFRVDAPGYAASKGWVFTLEHRGSRFVWAVLLGLMVVPFVLDDSPISTTAIVVGNAGIAAWTFVNRFHRTYSPWCPYCHPGGGGGHEEFEVPDPSGGLGRPVPA